MAIREDLSNFIWQIADLLRGPYRPPQYERVMLPMTVLRRFDCVLEPTKERVLAEYERQKGRLDGEALDSVLNKTAGQRFHNHSPLTFEKLKGDPDQIDKHLQSYIDGFSTNVSRIFSAFEFTREIEKLQESNLLYLVVAKFCDIDLHPTAVDNIEMGLLFEDLIRRFNEQANETAGDHFTPREVIQLIVDILFAGDDEFLTRQGTVRKLLDPACGTGGMLAEAQRHLLDHHMHADLYVYGQDFNPRAYAMAASDSLIKGDHKGRERSRIEFGDSLIDDKFQDETFDYFLANPPFGVDWKRQQKQIVREHEKQGDTGRFGAGLPRINDGSLLFLQHMISKFEPVCLENQKHGSRLGIVFSGSPLFTGGAGSGESNIRRWIIENDWLDAIVALPEQMFYNTGIGTYVWIVTNRKDSRRRGKIQLIDARDRWKPLRRSLGDKRRELGRDDIAAVVREYGAFVETETSKLFDNEEFGHARVTVERPLRLCYRMDLDRKARFFDSCPHLLDDVQVIDASLGRERRRDWNGISDAIESILYERGSRWRVPEMKLFREVMTDRDPEGTPVIAKRDYPKHPRPLSDQERFRGWFPEPAQIDPAPTPGDLKMLELGAAHVRFEPDPQLRDFENITLKEDVDDFFAREVLPYVPDAWMDREKDKIGYEINFNRHFYRFTPSRPLAEIDAELKAAEEKIMRLLQEVTA